MRNSVLATILAVVGGCQPTSETRSPSNPLKVFNEAVPAGSCATFYQRFADNNHWDDGKSIELAVAVRILELLNGSIEYDPVGEGHVVAIGVAGPHYFSLGFTSSLEFDGSDSDAAAIKITFCFDAEHFMDRSDTYFVVPAEHRAELAEVLDLLHDDARNPPT